MFAQYIIVGIVLAGCVVYTCRRLWRRFHASSTNARCAGCPLADTCNHTHHSTSCDCCS